MIDTPEVIELPAQALAFVHLVIPRDQIQHVMGPGLQEVKAAVAAQGIAEAGPWLTHHRRITPDGFDFEICIPVERPIAASGRVQAGEWPAMRVARTNYRGPYEELYTAWPQLDAWIAENGHEGAVDLWERYVSGPWSSPNPEEWCTELNRPLLG